MGRGWTRVHHGWKTASGKRVDQSRARLACVQVSLFQAAVLLLFNTEDEIRQATRTLAQGWRPVRAPPADTPPGHPQSATGLAPARLV
jgi:hypothetical protein